MTSCLKHYQNDITNSFSSHNNLHNYKSLSEATWYATRCVCISNLLIDCSSKIIQKQNFNIATHFETGQKNEQYL